MKTGDKVKYKKIHLEKMNLVSNSEFKETYTLGDPVHFSAGIGFKLIRNGQHWGWDLTERLELVSKLEKLL